MRYRIEYSPESEGHLRSLTARQRSMILDEVDAQLSHEPAVETRNRKRMRESPLGQWALRVGGLRVYYNVTEGPQRVVRIRGVGVKDRNRVRIGGKEMDL